MHKLCITLNKLREIMFVILKYIDISALSVMRKHIWKIVHRMYKNDTTEYFLMHDLVIAFQQLASSIQCNVSNGIIHNKSSCILLSEVHIPEEMVPTQNY